MVAGLLLSHIWRWHDITPGVQVLKIAAITTVLSWAFLLFKPRWPVIKKALGYPYVWLYLIWTTWLAAGLPWALDPSRASTFFNSNFLKTVAAYIFLLTFVSNYRSVRVLTGVHAVGASVVAFYYIKSGLPRDWTPISMYDPNDLALHLAMALPLSLFFALSGPKGTLSRLRWMVPVILGMAALGSQSRGTLLAFGVAATYLLLTARAIPLRLRILPPIALVLGVAMAPANIQERFSTLLSLESDYNTQAETGRVATWERGLSYLKQRPLTGYGISGFEVADRRLAPQADVDPFWYGKSPHNSVLQAAVESGVPGALLFASIFVTVIVRLWRLRSRLTRGRSETAVGPAVLADLLICSVVIYLVGGFFLSLAYAFMPVTILAMAAGLEMQFANPRRNSRS